MPARVWQALAGIIMLLLIAVVGLDQWQARRGEASLFGSDLFGRAARRPAAPAAPATLSRALPEAAPLPPGAPRVAVIVDDLGSRRDVFDVLREIRRPLTVAVLPALPLSAADRAGRLARGHGGAPGICRWSRTGSRRWIRARARC